MAYIRPGEKLYCFNGTSQAQVYPNDYADGRIDSDAHIGDTETTYGLGERLSFADLIARIVYIETNDREFAYNIAKNLAEGLNIKEHLRDKCYFPKKYNDIRPHHHPEFLKVMADMQEYKHYFNEICNKQICEKLCKK